MKSIVDITDLNVDELQALIDTALDIIAHPEKYAHACEGKKLATLFFEPSTRTRMSFEAAMYELGGHVISMTDPATSSVSKGETVGDTVQVVSNYADIIAQRHPKDGAAYAAIRKARIPVINAGDGMHAHPTQTLADLLTIYREKGRFNGLTVGMCGDLKYGRTVHSLVGALSRYSDIRFVFISPEELKMPAYVTDTLDRQNLPYEVTTSLESAIGSLDILYMTRIQKERFDSPAEYERLKNSYILDMAKLSLARPDCSVLHPLPRVNEIAVEVDDDPRACYFKQVLNGKYMRMALILKLLDEAARDPKKTLLHSPEAAKGLRCRNPRCICSIETGIEHVFIEDDRQPGHFRCAYCEAETE